jgi:predicted anti-sigma-YlaC factor YlaD
MGSPGATDVGHLVLTVLTFAFILSVIVLGALSLGRPFRWYSIATAVVILVTGAIVGIQVAGLPAGSATPWMGFTERISAYGMMLYVAAVAVALWRRSDGPKIPSRDAGEMSTAA